jgi:hypothetical protein
MTKLLGCFPEDTELEARVLEHKEALQLTDEQSVELHRMSKVDVYVELLALREYLNELSNKQDFALPTKRQRLEAVGGGGPNALKIVEDVHTRLRASLIDACKENKNGVMSTISQGAMNLIQQMRDTIICEIIGQTANNQPPKMDT